MVLILCCIIIKSSSVYGLGVQYNVLNLPKVSRNGNIVELNWVYYCRAQYRPYCCYWGAVPSISCIWGAVSPNCWWDAVSSIYFISGTQYRPFYYYWDAVSSFIIIGTQYHPFIINGTQYRPYVECSIIPCAPVHCCYLQRRLPFTSIYVFLFPEVG